MAELEYSERAVDWLRSVDAPIRERVLSKLEEITEWPEHYLLRMSGSEFYRVRVGDYRAIIEWRKDDDILFVRRIGHRRTIYD